MSSPSSVDRDPPPDHGPEPQQPPRGVRTMSAVRWVLVALTAVIATGSILSYCGGKQSATTTTSSTGQV